MSKKVTELTELTAIATNDLFIVEDVSASTTKKITWDNLVDDASITTAKLVDGAVTYAKTDGTIWWQYLLKTTLGSAGDLISVTPFTAKKYLRIYITAIPSGAIRCLLRFNNDSASNYAQRFSYNTAATTVNVSQSAVVLSPSETSLQLLTLDVVNISAQEKVISGMGFTNGSAGAAGSPTSIHMGGKWANTSSQITRVDIINDQAGDFAIGSEVIVLGHD